MKTKIKLSRKEVANYINEYHTLSGHTLKPDYLTKVKIRAFFSREGMMLGGYLVNDKPPYRYCMLIGEEKFNEALQKKSIDQNDLVEASCMWISRKANIMQIISIYDWFAKDIEISNKKYLIGASTQKNIFKYFQKAIPNLLYHGIPYGAPKFKEIWLYGTNTFLLRAKIWSILVFITPKIALKYFQRKFNLFQPIKNY